MCKICTYWNNKNFNCRIITLWQPYKDFLPRFARLRNDAILRKGKKEREKLRSNFSLSFLLSHLSPVMSNGAKRRETPLYRTTIFTLFPFRHHNINYQEQRHSFQPKRIVLSGEFFLKNQWNFICEFYATI